MQHFTWSSIRTRLSTIAKPILNSTFSEVYENHIQEFSKEELLSCVEPIRDFIEKICGATSRVQRDSIIKSEDPIVICAFFYRYHIAVNIIVECQASGEFNQFTTLDDSNATFLRAILFGIATGDTSI